MVAFPVPKDADFLTHKSREEFLNAADLSTSEKRMKQLLVEAPIFMAEMQQVLTEALAVRSPSLDFKVAALPFHNPSALALSFSFSWLVFFFWQIYLLSQWSSTYKFIHHNIVNIKWSMYALVVMLNLNIVMASYGEGSKDGYKSIIDGLVDGNVQDKYRNSLYISAALATLNLIGYIIIVTFLAVTEVPIIIRQLDDYVQECLDSIDMKEADYRDLGAFTWY